MIMIETIIVTIIVVITMIIDFNNKIVFAPGQRLRVVLGEHHGWRLSMAARSKDRNSQTLNRHIQT